jgi:hypothetical protein
MYDTGGIAKARGDEIRALFIAILDMSTYLASQQRFRRQITMTRQDDVINKISFPAGTPPKLQASYCK